MSGTGIEIQAQNDIPYGWSRVKEGKVIVGDRCWMYCDEIFSKPEEIGSVIIDDDVESKWCVIRRNPLTVDASKTLISKLVRAAIKHESKTNVKIKPEFTT